MVVFLLLSLISVVMSGAPLKVHAVDVSALFIAFVIPSVITNKNGSKNPLLIWLLGSIVGILYWDIVAAYVIVKKELFMSWYIVYPVGISLIILLQITTKYISRKKHNAL